MAPALADSLSVRLAAVEERITAACRRAGRDPADVRLVGVTKGVDTAIIRSAAEAGLNRFGENYVQEWMRKRDGLADVVDLEWHFIGRIQRNKAAAVAEATLVHSVADLRTASSLDASGARRGVPVRVLVQVNLGGEQTKGGTSASALPDLLESLRRLEWLRVEGLMTVPPPLAPSDVRGLFRELRMLRDQQTNAAALRELSMGMSADFDVAIEEGATLVRVGSAIFGPRKGAM